MKQLLNSNGGLVAVIFAKPFELCTFLDSKYSKIQVTQIEMK